MRISGIETFVCAANWRNFVFVRVDTDAGLHGWGAWSSGLPNSRLSCGTTPFVATAGCRALVLLPVGASWGREAAGVVRSAPATWHISCGL